MNRLLKLTFLALIGSYCAVAFAVSDTTQIGRYSTVRNKASQAQINPLLAIGQFKFPPSVVSIGDAIQMVLQPSSYTLVPRAKLSNDVKETLDKRLPLTDRNLGPLALKDALVVLMGKEVFHLMVDPVHREINFEIKPAFAKAFYAHPEKHHVS